jgi:hypothetical protein
MLASVLLLNTAAGPLGVGVVSYPISSSMLNQLIGLEAVTVLLVVPAMAWAAVLAFRGDPVAPLVAFGPTSYAAYMFVQYVLGPEYDTYSLTVLVQVAIASVAGALSLWAWGLAGSAPMPALSLRTRRWQAGLLAGLAGFVLLRYLPVFVGSLSHRALDAEFVDARTFFWSIVLLDLGVVVPGAVIAAVALWRGRTVGARAFYAVVGWFALTPPSVAAMAAVMIARDDPHASWPTFMLLTTAALVFLAAAVVVFGRLVGRPDGCVDRVWG